MQITLYLRFARTEVIHVETNTAHEFVAQLKDNLGKYNAVVKRNIDGSVDVLFDGAPNRRRLDLDYAKWEFSSIWSDLDSQGHKVLALC